MLTFPTARTVALTVDEITQRKQELQCRLEIFVRNELSNFQDENCVSISDVFFDFTTGGVEGFG